MTALADRVVDRLADLAREDGGRLFAVLDGARDPAIHARAREHGACLFPGEVPDELAQVAPWVVELGAGREALAAWLARAGWGHAWGVFVVSGAPAAQVQAHLRTLLEVKDAQGRRELFRWFDPRVLRPYLPLFTGDAQARLFGPVTAFLVEDEAPAQGLLRFRPGPAGPAEERLALAAPAPPPSVSVSVGVSAPAAAPLAERVAAALDELARRGHVPLRALREALQPVGDGEVEAVQALLSPALERRLSPAVRASLAASCEVLLAAGRLGHLREELQAAAGDEAREAKRLASLPGALRQLQLRVEGLQVAGHKDLDALAKGLQRLTRGGDRHLSAKVLLPTLNSVLISLGTHREPVDARERAVAEGLLRALDGPRAVG